ncbi:MAG: WYL domain-containing protein, partial [Actinomycetota bacterium]
MNATKRSVRAEDRLRRLLVMLPWLMEVEHVPLADVAARFDMTEAEVVRDLELVAMCGLPPYVDEMIDVFVDDGLVFVGVPRLFRRSLRLTAPEAFSLLAAARTAAELPGADADGALQSGLDRIAAALRDAGVLGEAAPDAGAPTTGVEIDLDRPPLADDVAAAVADGAELEIDYYSPTRDEVAPRLVIPRHVFVDRGNWYMRANDGTSEEERTFRIDRIERLERTGVRVEVDPALAEPAEFFTDRDVPRVQVARGARRSRTR